MGIEKKIKTIKEGLSRRAFPIAGDFVELPDGRVGRLSVIRKGEKVQMVGHYDSISIYLAPDIFPIDASGCVWDPDFDDVDIDISTLSDTGKTKIASAWTFRGLPEAGGGFDFDFDFKVWKVDNLK